jgi:hypothetical protein
MKWTLVIYVILVCALSNAQEIDYYPLHKSLNEISGLEQINDTTLVALNDGGNDEELFLLNLKGKIIKKVQLTNCKNKDWEDITTDGTHLYIGDIGNNSNKRQNLRIFKVSIEDVLKKKEIRAKEISFSYKEQISYPPSDDSLFYDAEGMTFYDGEIWVFTKNRSADTDGNSWVYKVPTEPGTYELEHSEEVYIGKSGWLIDGITAVDNHGDDFYILTYNRFMIKRFNGKTFEDVYEYEFDGIAQRESLLVVDEKTLFVADEKNPLVGAVKLYRIKLNGSN